MHRLLRLSTALPFATPKSAPPASLFRRTMSSESELPQKKMAHDHPGCYRDMRRTFYIDAVVDKVMNKSLGHPFLMWTKTRAEWYRLLKSEAGCRALLRSRFLGQLRALMQEDEFEATKRFGSEKVCLGRSFAEHNRIKWDLYHFKYRALAEAAAAERKNLRAVELTDEPGMAMVDDLLEDSGVGARTETMNNQEPEALAKAVVEDAKEGEKDTETAK